MPKWYGLQGLIIIIMQRITNTWLVQALPECGMWHAVPPERYVRQLRCWQTNGHNSCMMQLLWAAF
jgi:hypothetical protein